MESRHQIILLFVMQKHENNRAPEKPPHSKVWKCSFSTFTCDLFATYALISDAWKQEYELGLK